MNPSMGSSNLKQTARERTLTQESFDRLLYWLSQDREQAGIKYEVIRSRLIKIFTCRGCLEPEELADETINRVTLKLGEIVEGYVGDPALYFYGVAQKVCLEYMRRKRPPPPVVLPLPEAEEEREYECLEKCMNLLPQDNRRLVLQYYSYDGREKIESRKELALKLGIALNALRIRAHRIRLILQQCVEECLGAEH